MASAAARLLSGSVLTIAIATAPLGSAPALLASTLVLGVCLLALRPRARRLVAIALPAIALTALVCLPLLVADPSRAPWVMARTALATLVATVVASSLRESEFAGALRALHVPAELAAVIGTMLRQAGALRGEGQRLVLARRLRGARGAAVGPDVVARLLVRAAERGERVGLAMALRGYDVRAGAKEPLRLADAPLLAASAVLALTPHLAPKVAS